MKICPVETRVFHADRQTDMMKLTVTFCNFANVPNMLSDSGPIHYVKGFCCRDWLVEKWDLNSLSLLLEGEKLIVIN